MSTNRANLLNLINMLIFIVFAGNHKKDLFPSLFSISLMERKMGRRGLIVCFSLCVPLISGIPNSGILDQFNLLTRVENGILRFP
jgi:hypothetical protein